jgi:CheY-like chemotaxis protein
MKQTKILLVDDNESVRNSLNALLTASDFQVPVATNVSKSPAEIAFGMPGAIQTQLHWRSRVASILEREALVTIGDSLTRVEREDELTCVPLNKEQRTGHFPKLLKQLVHRLRVPRELGTKQVSEGAVQHGKIRHSQGYSIPMIIEESGILQVSIFETLRNTMSPVDFTLLLTDIMTIADECDSQLKQALVSFMGQQKAVASAA